MDRCPPSEPGAIRWPVALAGAVVAASRCALPGRESQASRCAGGRRRREGVPGAASRASRSVAWGVVQHLIACNQQPAIFPGKITAEKAL